MLNRPANVYRERDACDAAADRPWQVDARPAARLVWLFVLFALPAACVVARVAQLQQKLGGTIVSAGERTRETFEPIASRDGRILGADGRVLARDVAQFELFVNYRWLEEPADPRWLRRQALGRLSRSERADAARVAAEQRAVLAERAAMWRRLAALTGREPDDLAARRAAIQRRIERMTASVEERRHRPRSPEPAAAPASESDPPWKRGWHTVVAALTTSPERDEPDPLVLPEHLADHRLLGEITLEMAAEIESHPERYPGLSTRLTSWREYPQGPLAAHVIGLRRRISDEALAARGQQFPNGDPLDYQPGDRSGQAGVERTYDAHLRGVRGLRRIVRNGRGEIVAADIVRPPRPGRDIVLTLDLELHERLERLLDRALAERALRERDGAEPAGGCIVALDARTGAVLAAVSAPRFDLRIAAEPDADQWQALLDDPRRPLFHRAVAMALPPGSTFKALSAVALLESGRIDPDAKLFCQGFLDPHRPDRNRCYIYRHYGHGHGETDLNDALARSCNVYFFQAARTLGPGPLVEWAGRFGFGRPTGIDLPGEAAGRVPRPPERDAIVQAAATIEVESRSARHGSPPAEPWYPGDTLGLAIGQSRLTTTPLQIARMMAVIANGGWLVTPHVVRGFGPSFAGEDDATLPASSEPQRVPGLNAGTLERLREGLERVVAHPVGTGYRHVQLEQVAIVGKTGTAEVGGARQDHAWFAGYVPADRPKVAFAVVLEHGGSGAAVAGSVARELARTLLELRIVE